MIAIINTGQTTKMGYHIYRLQINEEVLGTFIHKRSNKLAACLREAAYLADTLEVKEENDDSKH